MEDNRFNRSDDDQPTLIGDSASGSSSTGITPPKKLPTPSDAPTIIDLGPDAATMVGSGSKAPRPSMYSSAPEGDGLLEAGTVLA
jgi:hypothetical protein